MGRLGANAAPSQGRTGQNQRAQEYHFLPVTQNPETIDDAPPPIFEISNDENQQENSEVAHHEPEPTQEVEMNGHNQNQKALVPVTFPPPDDQISQPNDSLPTKNTQMRSTLNNAHQRPQAFPPSHHELGKPQAFPPPQDYETPQAFAPPPREGVHAFPPPQQDAFQQTNMPQFLNNQATNFSTTPIHLAAHNSHMIHPNGQVMNNTPPMTGNPLPLPLPTKAWETGLFSCMDDPTNALITACFPCVTFGQIVEIIDSGQTSCGSSGMLYGLIACFTAMPCLYSCTYRTKLRARYGLMETPAPDWIIHCFCECCALCQEYRELKKWGLDPSIGWSGNVVKSQQMIQQHAMMPPVNQVMMG